MEQAAKRDRTVHIAVVIGLWALTMAVFANASSFEMTAPVQAELDRQKSVIAEWAADPVIVSAVREQNGKGPIAGMDNAKWKTTRRSDALVKALQASPAGTTLRARLEKSAGVFSEAFLNAARGEKVAFVEKTTSYVHAGQAKFDVPYGTGKPWQGKPEFDESSQTYAVQISVPVLESGKPIGALVVGVNLTHLEKVAKK
jgi:hypothetical protein